MKRKVFTADNTHFGSVSLHAVPSETKGGSPNSGQQFNTTIFDRVRSEKRKKTTVSLYLNELPNLRK